MATEKEMKARRKKKLEKEFGAMYSNMGSKKEVAAKAVKDVKDKVAKKVTGKSMTAGRPKPIHVVTDKEISPAMLMKFIIDYIKLMLNGAPPPMPSGNVTAVDYEQKSVDRMSDRGYYSFDARVSGNRKPYYKDTVGRSEVDKDWARPEGNQGRRTRSTGGRKSGLSTDGAKEVIAKQRRKQQSPVSMAGIPRDEELPIKRDKSTFSTSSLSSGGFGGGYTPWGMGYVKENSAFVGGEAKKPSRIEPQIQGVQAPKITSGAVNKLLSKKV